LLKAIAPLSQNALNLGHDPLIGKVVFARAQCLQDLL
jgi:hypothetical protein